MIAQRGLPMRRLRPVPQRTARRPALVLAAVAVLIAALPVLGHGLGGAPLAEDETSLAIAVQRIEGRSSAGEEDDASAVADDARSSGAADPALAELVAIAPRLIGSSELSLRSTGVLAGALALALLVDLGERLFATRVGVLAAALLIALPTGRRLLGRELGVEPYVLLASVVALLGIRRTGEKRAAALVAGLAGGFTIVLSGPTGFWVVLMALLWLRGGQGLTPRSAASVVGCALGVVLAIAGGLAIARGSLAGLGTQFAAHLVAIGTTGRPRVADLARGGEDLLPILPALVLGWRLLPSRWRESSGVRFATWWLGLAAIARLLGGPTSPAYAALVLLVAAVAEWGLEHARRPAVIGVLAAGGVIVLVLTAVRAPARAAESLDRWAAREAGRFVGRVIPDQRRIAAQTDVGGRIEFYANRPIERLASGASVGSEIDYVVLDRSRLRAAKPVPNRSDRRPIDRGTTASHLDLRSIAEFGGWTVARCAPAQQAP